MARPRLAWMLGLLIVALPQSAAAAGWKALVVNDRHGGGGETVSVLDTQAETVIRTVAVGFTPFGIAITPDARTAWVANVDNPVPGEASLQSIDLTANPIAAGPRLPTDPDQPITVAITPDGTSAYAAAGTSLVRLDLTKSPAVVSHTMLTHTTNFIAVTPNGRTAYLSANDGSVVPVDLTTHQEGTAIPVGGTPRGLAVTPDGTRVVVAVNGTDSVRVIDTATNGLAAKAPAVPGANEVAITPDGATAWVTTWNGTDESATTTEDGYVIPVNLGSLTAGTRVNVRNSDSMGQAWGVAITPDGRKLYVSDGRSNNTNPNGTTVRAVDLAASPPVAGTPITVGMSPRVIAITPDQAPIARFNVTAVKAGAASSFDASISTPGATTPTVRYDWDFGNGTKATTSGPTTTHTYSSGGSFPVTLTETTAGG